jgi:pyridinium-3,5-biscarboxylic acid mononucleotide synthase
MYLDLSSFPFQNGCIKYHDVARMVSMKANALTKTTDSNARSTFALNGAVAVVTAGTTDIPVSEEAAITLEAAGCTVDRIYDCGVAGLHRIIRALPRLTHSDISCIIVCAGMDGALPSVVGGLVRAPVIAVPTSVGYGASFSGVSALLTMLNSCSPGVSVVNIDNGFGAAAFAYKCIHRS